MDEEAGPVLAGFRNSGDDGTRTRGLCDSLGIHVLSATYILAGAAKSLKGTVGTSAVGKFVGKNFLTENVS